MEYLKKGSTGDGVTELQDFLIRNGYKLTATGTFDDITDAALRNFQKNYGLEVDGVYGPESQATMYRVTAPKFNTTNYNDTTEGKAGWEAKTSADKAVNEYGDFSYAKDGTLQDVMDRILNREKFSYDLDGDALYQQYKDKYIKQGKMAMEDTMGQAAAMTGGYGNSYAQTAGQQAYNAQLDNLNDIVPELYQMAYDRYNQEGQDLYNQYSLLSADKDSEYGMWADGYNRLTGERDYASNSYYNAADLYNTNLDRTNSLAQQDWTNKLNAYTTEEEKKSSEDEEPTYGISGEYTARIPAGDGKKQETYTYDAPPPLEYADTEAAKLFSASIKTKNEFYTRGGSDKAKYKTYEKYIEGVLDKWLSEGRLTDNEAATILLKYGLA